MSQFNTQHVSAAIKRLPFNDITDVVSVTQPSTGRITVERCGDPYSPTFQLRVRLTGATASITSAQAFTNLPLFTLAANGNHLYNLVSGDVQLTAGSGIPATSNVVDVAVGTAAASNTTLATTMLNICPKVDVSALVASVQTFALASADTLTTATNTCFLNLSVPTGMTADTTVAFDGELVFNIQSVRANRAT